MDRRQIYIAIALLGITRGIFCQDFSLNLISRVPEGIPGVDYPTYTSVPRRLSFTCRDRKPGFYADPETRCQAWHWCDTFNIKHSFICSNMTLFNQKIRGCDWWYNVDCDLATSQYINNDELYQNNQPVEQSDQERRHANEDAQRRQKQLEDATVAPDQGVAESIDGAVHPNSIQQTAPENTFVDNNNNNNNNVNFQQQDGITTFQSDPIVTAQPQTFPTPDNTPVVTFTHPPTEAPRAFHQVRPLTNRFPGSPNNFIANIPNAIPIAFPPPPAPRPNVHPVFVQPEILPQAHPGATSGLSTLTAEDNLLDNNFQQDNGAHTSFGSFVSSTSQAQPPTSTFAQQPEVNSFVTNQPELRSFATNQPDVTTFRQRPSPRGRPGSFQGPFFASSTAAPTVFDNAPITTTHIPTPSPSSGFDFGVHVDPVTNRIFTFSQSNDQNGNNVNFQSAAPPTQETEIPFAPTFGNSPNTSPIQQFPTTTPDFNNQFIDTETLSTIRDDDDIDDDQRDFQRFNSVPPIAPGFGGHVADTNNVLPAAGEPAGSTTINLDAFFAETAPHSTSPPPPPPPSTTLPPTPRQSQFRPFSPRGTTPQRHTTTFRPTFQTSSPAHASFAPTTVNAPSSSQHPVSNSVPEAIAASPPSQPFNLAIPFGARLKHAPAPESNNVLDNSATVRRHDGSGSSSLSTKRSAVDTVGITTTSTSTSRQKVERASVTSAPTTTAPPTSTTTPVPSTTSTAPPPSTTDVVDSTTPSEPEELNSLPSSTFEPSRRRKFVMPHIRSRGPTFPPFFSTAAPTTEEGATENGFTSTDDSEADISTTLAPFTAKPFRTKRRKTPRTTPTQPTTAASKATESNEIASTSSTTPTIVNSTRGFKRPTPTNKPTKFLKSSATESTSGLKRRTFPSFPITTFRPSTPFPIHSRGRVVDGHFGQRKQRRHPSTTLVSIELANVTRSPSTESALNNDVTHLR